MQIACPIVTGWPHLNRHVADDARAVRAHLVLHLHRLDDADHPTGFDRVAVCHPHLQDGSLHRAHHAVGRTPCSPGGGAFPPATCELAVRRLGHTHLHLHPAAVDLGKNRPFDRAASDGRAAA